MAWHEQPPDTSSGSSSLTPFMRDTCEMNQRIHAALDYVNQVTDHELHLGLLVPFAPGCGHLPPLRTLLRRLNGIG